VISKEKYMFSLNIFLADFDRKRQPLRLPLFHGKPFFLGPGLSYFAEFAAGWQ
jgi:hypothetical protein